MLATKPTSIAIKLASSIAATILFNSIPDINLISVINQIYASKCHDYKSSKLQRALGLKLTSSIIPA